MQNYTEALFKKFVIAILTLASYINCNYKTGERRFQSIKFRGKEE